MNFAEAQHPRDLRGRFAHKGARNVLGHQVNTAQEFIDDTERQAREHFSSMTTPELQAWLHQIGNAAGTVGWFGHQIDAAVAELKRRGQWHPTGKSIEARAAEQVRKATLREQVERIRSGRTTSLKTRGLPVGASTDRGD